MTHRPKRLGLLLLTTLCMLVSTAGGAHAAGEIRIGGKTFSELKITEETFTGSLSGEFKLLVAEKLPFQINCKELTVTKGVLLEASLHGVFTFSKCTVLEDKEPFGEISCTVAPIEVSALGETVKHNGEFYILFKPSSGTLFATVGLSGDFCTLVGSYPLEGTFAVDPGVEKEKLELSVISNGLLGDSLTFNGSTTTPSGIVLISASGTNKGKTLSITQSKQEEIEKEKEKEGEFLIEGATFAGLGITEETIAGGFNKGFSLLVPSKNYEINCAKGNISAGKLLLKGVADMTIQPSSCTVLERSTKKEFPGCITSISPIKVKGLVFLNAGKVFLLFEQSEGKTLIIVETEAGACFLPEIMNLNGTFVAEFEVEKAVTQNLVVSEKISGSFGDQILLSTTLFAPEGTLQLELTGKYKGKAWGAK
jgi:hypothetical protein